MYQQDIINCWQYNVYKTLNGKYVYVQYYIPNKHQLALLATTLVIYKLKECKILHEVYFVLKFIYF